MEIIKINNSFVLDSGPTYTVFTEKDGCVTLFDTCLTKDNAKKIDKLIKKPVSRIINTHSHADHIGGNSYFQDKYHCPVFVNSKEISFCLMPGLEPSMLYGGSPFSAAEGKFLCAGPSRDVSPIGDTGVTFVELPGHSPGLTGFITDDIFFMGDAIFSEDNISKHKLLYLYDVENFLKSLKKISETDFRHGVFCHKGIVEKSDILNLIDLNISHTNDIVKLIIELIAEQSPITAEDITVKLMRKLSINESAESFLLNSSTIKGYLRMMEKSGAVAFRMDGGIKWIAL